MSDNLQRFKALFEGRSDAFGQYPRPEKQLAGQKVLASGRRSVAPGNEGYFPLTDEVWQAHLDGKMGLGIVPVRQDAHVGFFVLDVDKYTIEGLHEKLVKQIDGLGLPLVVTRSKSGGAHVWCFLARPIPAIDAIRVAREWKKKLGLDEFGPKCEIFPKQNAVADMDVGSWINLPYFGGDNLYDHRFGYGPRGQQLTLADFIRYAEARKGVSVPEDLARLTEEITPEVAGPVLGKAPALIDHQQAPPCMKHMLVNGVQEGGRDNALYQAGVYFQRAFPDDWRERLDAFNQKHLDPQLSSKDVMKTVASLAKGQGIWRYKCDEHQHICDKEACSHVAFGVGTVHSISKDIVQRTVSVNNPEGERYFIFHVQDGAEFRVTASGMQTARAFETGYLNATGKVFKFPRGLKWWAAKNQLIESAERVEAADVMTSPTMVVDTFHDWVFAQAGYHGKAQLESLQEGCAVYLPETKEIVFKAAAFRMRLDRQGIRLDTPTLWSIMEKHLKVSQKKVKVNQGYVRVLSVPCEEPWFDATIADEEEGI